MTGWITKASKALKRQSTPADDPFNLSCVCGNPLKGHRRPRYQRLVCKGCGEATFVLPANTYPKSRAQKRRSKPVKPKQPQKRPIGFRAGAKPKTVTPPEQPKTPRVSPVEQIKHGIDAASLQCRKAMTPFRLIVLAMIAIVGLTIAWTLRSRSLDVAREDLRAATEAGYAALEKPDWAVAYEQFQIADRALDRLGSYDANSLSVRQAYREVSAVLHLTDKSLFALIEDANATVSEKDIKAWEKRFQDIYQDAWIIVQSDANALTISDEATVCEFQYPLYVGDAIARVRADAAVLDRFQISSDPKTVIFAAQLNECRRVEESPCVWEIELNAETAFLWANYETFEAIGFRPDKVQTEAAMRDILGEQCKIIGIEE